jgi:hypothetical protein
MAKFLGVDIPKLLNGAMGKLLYSGTFTSVSPGTRTPGSPGTGRNPVATTYSFKGFAGSYDQMLPDRQLVRSGNIVIAIVAASGTMSGIEPKSGDRAQLVGDPQLGSRIASIMVVHRDPATAMWLCEAQV